MMYLKASIIFAIFPLLNSQMIHFPIDYQVNEASPEGINLAALRGTPAYGVYIEQIISTGNTKLALAVNKALIQLPPKKTNVIIAPMSITVALALVLLGAKGKTFNEVSNIMGLAAGVDIQGKSLVVHEHLNKILQKLTESSGIDLDHQLFLTSAIFVQKDFPIRNLYKQTAETIYKSSVLNVDFKHDSNKAVEVMNAWVTEKTKGKIKSILAMPPSESTRVVIASALYFKALWEHPFFAEMTFRRPFYTNGRKSPATMEVEMMSNGGKFPYYKDPTLKCEIMGLPYKGNATTMYIIVPSDSSAERLKEFQRTLTQQDVDRLADSTEPRCVVMGFPKMKIESTIELRDVLSSLGVQSLFQAGEANLAMLSPGEMMADAPITLRNPENNPIVNCSNIFNPNSTEKLCETTDGTKKILFKKFGDKVGRRVVKRDALDSLRELVNEQSSGNFQNPGLYASNVIHKVYMDITETGTEAAASTAIALARSTEVTFRVDVPFLFFIRHEFTKTILFWGSVTEPTPSFPRT